MSIYDTKHDAFRNAVISTLTHIAVVSSAYDDEDKKTQYICTSVDAAFTAIRYCFTDEYYVTLNDTVCRNCAYYEVINAIENDTVDSITAESVFEDIDDMQDDDDDDDDCE